MAKKKPTHHHHPNSSSQTEPQHHQQQQSGPSSSAAAVAGAMESDLSEKYSTLQTLNSELIRQVAATRNEVNGLTGERDLVRSELTRSNSVIGTLEAEMVRLRDEIVGLEKVKGENEGLVKEREEIRVKVMDLEKRVRVISEELERERGKTERVVAEKEDLVKELKTVIDEGERLRALVVEAEEKAVEAKSVKLKYEEVVSVIEEKERVISLMGRELDAVRNSLDESKELMNGLKKMGEEVAKEKEDLEKERDRQALKVKDLEEEVGSLKGEVSRLREIEGELKLKLGEMERVNDEAVKKWELLSVELSALLREKEEKEREIVRLMEEKLVAMERTEELMKELESVRRMYEELISEKDELEQIRSRLEKETMISSEEIMVLREELSSFQVSNVAQSEKIKQLLSEIGRLKDLLDGVGLERDEALKAFDEVMGVKSELEKTRTRLEEEVLVLQKEIMELKEALSVSQAANADQSERNKQLVSEVMQYKDSLNLVTEERDGARRDLDELTFVKNELERVKSMLESDIAGLEKEVTELRGQVCALQDSNANHVEKNSQLLADISKCKCSLEAAISERDEARKALDEERLNGVDLRKVVADLSKKMEEAEKELMGTRLTNESLKDEKNGLVIANSNLMDEKNLVVNKLSETHQKLDDLRDTLHSKEALLENLMAMLKKTAKGLSSVEGDKNGVEDPASNGRDLGGEMMEHIAELEAIKSAFKSREAMVQEMKQEMKSLQSSVVQARKKKGFWAMVSSATTILAAVISLAYAARVR